MEREDIREELSERVEVPEGKAGGQRRSVTYPRELRRLAEPFHPTAAMLRFWMNVRGYGLAAAGERPRWAANSLFLSLMPFFRGTYGH